VETAGWFSMVEKCPDKSFSPLHLLKLLLCLFFHTFDLSQDISRLLTACQHEKYCDTEFVPTVTPIKILQSCRPKNSLFN